MDKNSLDKKHKKVKSKSFLDSTTKQNVFGKVKGNVSMDFANLYKSATESTGALLQVKKDESLGMDKENDKTISLKDISLIDDHSYTINKRLEHPMKEKKNKTKIRKSGDTLDMATGISNNSKLTSTPLAFGKNKKHEKASSSTPLDVSTKSIIKNKSYSENQDIGDSFNGTDHSHTGINKGKKRNKSVSFMLDETEVISIKKSKSEESSVDTVDSKATGQKSKQKKAKLLHIKHGKRGMLDSADVSDINDFSTKVKKERTKIFRAQTLNMPQKTSPEEPQPKQNHKTGNDKSEVIDHTAEPKQRKNKKQKKNIPAINNEEDVFAKDADESSKNKTNKPETIAENLENLTIGDNPHTLTNLLDEMTVVDKKLKKKKKNKSKAKNDYNDKTKQPKAQNNDTEPAENGELEQIEEGKVKVKWNKRKWNKDKKGEISEDDLITTIIVGNLPLKFMLNYKKLLSEHFSKYGLIKKIGLAELYPAEESRPVFTTTVQFYSDGGATQALEEDNMPFEGSRIRVRRPLPPTETTVVVRSYGSCSEQNMTSIFASCGKIRNIREVLKGGRTICTAFVEFDGPEAVEKALKVAEDGRIGGKKLFVSKFENRSKNNKRSRKDSTGKDVKEETASDEESDKS